MSLTGMPFRVFAIVLAVVIAMVTLLAWNRVRGPKPVRVAARVGFMLAGQGAATLALLAWLNVAYGGLFVSWTDLLGDQTMQGASFVGQPGEVHLHPMSADSTPVPVTTVRQHFTDAGYGGVKRTILAGKRSGITSDVYVWTPPQYAKNPGERFPVLELLHGVPDSPRSWLGPMHVVAHLKAAIATGKVHPYILVVPEVTPIASRSAPWDNEECSDIPGDYKLDTWLTQDVRSMVVDNFRALDSADGWGLMGYSTGGFCAAKLVLQHPALYQAAVSLAGYYDPESLLLARDRRLDDLNSPRWLIGHERTPAVSLLMTASAQDRMAPPTENQHMLTAARANPRSRATELQSFVAPLGGGHNQSAWEKILPTAFIWLSARLSGPVTP
jgi:enterochelin esterase-like enzyme